MIELDVLSAAEQVAAVKDMAIEELLQQAYSNSLQLFFDGH